MSIRKKYKSLIQNTLFYIEASDIKFIETNMSSFKDELKKSIRKENDKENQAKKTLPISSQEKNFPKPISEKNQALQTKKALINNLEAKEENSTSTLTAQSLTSILTKTATNTNNNNIDKDFDDTANRLAIKNAFLTTKDLVNTTNQTSHIKTLSNNLADNKKNIDSTSNENKTIHPKIQKNEKPQIIKDNFNDIKNIVSNIAPKIKITDPLSDEIAKQNIHKYKLKNSAANITILAYRENERFYKFLEKLAVATNIYFYPTKIISAYLIEKQNSWDIFLSQDTIYLIISLDYTIFELPNLKKFYRENPTKKEKFLKDIPLFLLPDLSIYLKEPTLKKTLFTTLKQKIANLKK